MLVVVDFLYFPVFLYGIGSFLCYFYVGVFKCVGNISELFSEVSKCALLALFSLLIMLVCCVTFV
jgi:hypothetical protein